MAAFVLLSLLFLGACKRSVRQEGGPSDFQNDSLSAAVGDSTLYGRCGEAGMSTFCLITDRGDTLLLTRTGADGRYGQIFGDVNEGDRFALTLNAADSSVVRAINLSELNRFTGQYTIYNAQLVLRQGERSDTVNIAWLDADSLVVSYAGGRRVRFEPAQH